MKTLIQLKIDKVRSVFSSCCNSTKIIVALISEILKLVLAGRMGEAIERTSRLYPELLEHNQNLLFMLKCRQFVEMVNGSDVEICRRKSLGGFSPSLSSSRPNSPIQTSVIQSTKSYSNKTKKNVEELNQSNAALNGSTCDDTPVIRPTDDSDVEMDTAEEIHNGHGETCNGKSSSSNGYQNGNSHINSICKNNYDNEDDDMG